MPAPRAVGLLVRTGSPAAVGLAARPGPLAIAGLSLTLEPLFGETGGAERLLGAGRDEDWLLARAPEGLDGRHPWELAHQAASGLASALGLAEGEHVVFVEPDLEQQFPAFPRGFLEGPGTLAAAGTPAPQDPAQGTEGPGFAWFLDERHSDLRRARQAVANATGPAVRIAHFDTGYDPAHATVPPHLLPEFGRNFVEGGRDARDPGVTGVLRQPGHGTATLAILAGNRVAELQDFLGGAPLAESIPIRIASSVVVLRTSSVARALAYVLAPTNDTGQRLPPVDIVTMSMGGLASQAWAEGVNHAYDAGITLVAAAGNNFACGPFGLPTHLVVYPARFGRVIAVCGAMADAQPYYDRPTGIMQGNWGPASKMSSALAAFTPNMPWARMGAPHVVDMNGPGTSAATPQVAAAAAAWIMKYREALARCPEPWQRVEAVRHALFASAKAASGASPHEKLGCGILQAVDALGVQPLASMTKAAPDTAGLALLHLLVGVRGAAPIATPSPREAMFALEAAQLLQQWEGPTPSPFEEMAVDPDLPPAAMPERDRRRLIDALINHPDASPSLRTYLERLGIRDAVPQPSVPGPDAAPAPSAPPLPAPVLRRLRGFAFDPSLQQQLDTSPISEVTFRLPWEAVEPGPIGEYLDVIDYDPGSRCLYQPVDLNAPELLAQDGLPAADGTPQFHQQMVYAAASLTIANFERALGRRTLWAPGPPPDPNQPKDDSHFVQRLRVYPHAFRGANAYYSPEKKALLFGYYAASTDAPGEHLPGGMVFTCLSHDIVAHETTHALVDGLHRAFIHPTNADVLAFHEAFADLVALFQHFTFPEILRHQIASTGGDMRSHENLLGQLAVQFGRTTGLRGALRDAIGSFDPASGEWRPCKPDPAAYQTAIEPHARGAILVSAVFDAFLAIYELRTRDLLRLATGGAGILPAGAALHPDLVARLAAEAAKAADHVLGICIRALDYCPPVDLTFGEYLRALVTADHDLVPDDDLGYRVAFIDAFRRRGIYPHGVRTLSLGSLLWRGPHNDDRQPSDGLVHVIGGLREYAQAHVYARSRHDLFQLARRMRAVMHECLERHFAHGGAGAQDAGYLGLDLARPFEVHAVRLANRVGPDGQLLLQCIVEILQETQQEVDPDWPGAGSMSFVSGCTVVADLRSLAISYCVRKPADSQTRLARQRAFVADASRSVRATYMAGASRGDEPFARLHLSR